MITDIHMLQNALHQLEEASKALLMQFLIVKCDVMYVGIWWNII